MQRSDFEFQHTHSLDPLRAANPAPVFEDQPLYVATGTRDVAREAPLALEDDYFTLFLGLRLLRDCGRTDF